MSDLCLEKTHKILQEEAHLNFTEFQICDNVDLETIYLEFCSYYQIKFGKKPRFVKKVEQNGTLNGNGSHPTSQSSLPSISNLNNLRTSANKKRNSLKTPSINSVNSLSIFGNSPTPDNKEMELTLQISPLHNGLEIKEKTEIFTHNMNGFYRKPSPDFYEKHPSDWRDMIDSICK